MEELIEVAKAIGTFIAQAILIIVVCVKYLSKALKKPDISALLPKQNKLDMEITERMEYVKELLGADRIHFCEFHNNEHLSDYRSAYKFSCIYEVVKAGNKPQIKNCVNLPIATMPKFIHKLTTTEVWCCRDIEQIKEDMPSTYQFKATIGIKGFYDIVVKNKAGYIIGFLAVQWDSKVPDTINEVEIQKLVGVVETDLQKAKDLK